MKAKQFSMHILICLKFKIEELLLYDGTILYHNCGGNMNLYEL